MTHAIATLDDAELDAVSGGFTINVGSYDWVRQRATQTSTVSTSGSFNTISVSQGISQTAIVGSLVL